MLTRGTRGSVGLKNLRPPEPPFWLTNHNQGLGKFAYSQNSLLMVTGWLYAVLLERTQYRRPPALHAFGIYILLMPLFLLLLNFADHAILATFAVLIFAVFDPLPIP